MGEIDAMLVSPGRTRSDDDLAVEARHDRDAFLALYDRYSAGIEGYALARTYSADDAADIVSATFVRALARIYTFRPGSGTFAAWLFTICRHVVADHYRERRRWVRLAEDAPIAAATAGPEELALCRDEEARVRAALAVLTPDQRDAIALRYASDLPFTDVARILGRSEPAARMLVSRAVRALRHELIKEESP